MFNWLYKRLVDGMAPYMTSYLQDILSSEEFAAFTLDYTDKLTDRQFQRVMGKLGGIQKGLNYAAEGAAEEIGNSTPLSNQNFFNPAALLAGGQIDAKTLLANFIMQGLAQSQARAREPKEDNPAVNPNKGLSPYRRAS